MGASDRRARSRLCHSVGTALTASEGIVMEEVSAEAAAMASGVAPGTGAGGADTTRAPGVMKVVVAVDASKESLHALSWALDNVVRHHPGASVVVLHAQPRADHFAYPVAGHGLQYVPPTAVDSVRKTHEDNSRRVVSVALDVCRQKHASATAVVVEGDAKEAVCRAVEDMHADLLVLGSRGLGTIKRALLGSVSDYLAHHACCPVLIVKPPSKAHHK